MIVSSGVLSVVIVAALVVVALAPLFLLFLWFRDMKQGNLW